MNTPNWPAIDVIVPVYNEAQTIGAKLANLASMDYPRACLRILVVDGCSDDGTAELTEQLSRGTGLQIQLVRSEAFGKPAQVMAGLALTDNAWVLVTDADAHLPPGILRAMVTLARADERVGLVGTHVRPAGDDVLDQAHWTATNALRRLERRFGSAGLVVGPCYLARRELLAVLGSNTVADDVYLSSRALLAGHRIELVKDAVLEVRAPVGHRELIEHKVRKAMGYVRETARAVPYAQFGYLATSAVFVCRAVLLVALPLAVAGALAALVIRLGWVGAAAVLLALIGGARIVGQAGGRGVVTRTSALVLTPMLTGIVLGVAFLLLPFVDLSPRYAKVSLAKIPLPDADVT